VRLAKIETSAAARASSIDKEVMTLDQLEKLKPDDIFRQLYEQRFGNEAPADQLSAFAELMLP
jgi:exonuclease SbcD